MTVAPAAIYNRYLFDYRNGSMLREWMLNDHYLGPSALGDPDVSGTHPHPIARTRSKGQQYSPLDLNLLTQAPDCNLQCSLA